MVTFLIVVVGSVGACVVIFASIVVLVSVAAGSWHENFSCPIIRHSKNNRNATHDVTQCEIVAFSCSFHPFVTHVFEFILTELTTVKKSVIFSEDTA